MNWGFKKCDATIFVVVCSITSLFKPLGKMIWLKKVGQLVKIGKSSLKLNIHIDDAFEIVILAMNEVIIDMWLLALGEIL